MLVTQTKTLFWMYGDSCVAHVLGVQSMWKINILNRSVTVSLRELGNYFFRYWLLSNRRNVCKCWKRSWIWNFSWNGEIRDCLSGDVASIWAKADNKALQTSWSWANFFDWPHVILASIPRSSSPLKDFFLYRLLCCSLPQLLFTDSNWPENLFDSPEADVGICV